MELTMTGDYAVRAMVHLASLPRGTLARISEISREWDIPENILRKIVTHLAKSGILVSQRGVHGGILLARRPEELTLIDVIEAVEGPILLNRCLESPGACSRSARCPVHTVWANAQRTLHASLSSQTLADLAGAVSRDHSLPIAD